MTDKDTTNDQTKAEIAQEIASIVDGVDPTAYEGRSNGIYFDRSDLAALKRWIAVNADSLPESNEDD